jgi:putative Holliday junction resolvase
VSAGGAPPGRVLALDPGDVRIGVAISDPDRTVALPVGTIQVGRPPGELKAVAAIVADEDVTLIVVGEPRSMDGSRGPRAHHARAFAEAIGAVVDVPVELHDERLTTVEGERLLRDAGLRGRRRRAVIDATAAQVILRSWLDAQPR